MSIKQVISSNTTDNEIKYTNISTVVNDDGTPVDILSYKEETISNLTKVVQTLTKTGFTGTYGSPSRGIISYDVDTYLFTHSFGRKVNFTLFDHNNSEVVTDTLQTEDSILLIFPLNTDVTDFKIIVTG